MADKRKLSLPMQILIALIAGIAVGLVCYFAGWADFTANWLKPFGTVFINLLKFIVVPIVVLSMTDGIVSMGDVKKVGSVGWKTVAYFLVTTAVACVIGLAAGSIFKSLHLFPLLTPAEGEVFTGAASASFTDTFVNIFPSNMWKSFMNADMLPVIVISVLLGGGILAAGEKGKPAAQLIGSFYAVFGRITDFIISLSPIGVFTMISWVVATQGANIIGTLALVLLCAYIAYFIHTVLVYSLSVRLFAHISPLNFFRNAAPAMIFAFTSTSSVATLPVSRECCAKLGADEDVSSFVLPLGATVNMDGTAIYQCVAAVFLASCCGMELTLGQMALIVITATLASVGTAGVSGAGMIMLAMVLSSVGIPIDMIMIIYGVDRLFDMGRTALNVTGDISCALCVTEWENKGTRE